MHTEQINLRIIFAQYLCTIVRTLIPHFLVFDKNERRNPLVGKYIADFYFVNILLYNNKKYVSNTSVKSVKKHNDGKKGDFK